MRLVPILLVLAATLAVAEPAQRVVLYVNNVTGDDAFEGSAAAPMRTIMAAVRACPVGARIDVANTGVDYRETVSIEKLDKGSAEAPLIIDGNGACVTGLVVVPSDQWELLRDDIYYFVNRLGGEDFQPSAWHERKIGDAYYGIMPNSNWLGFRKHQGWFTEAEAPAIFMLNGKPGPSVQALDDLPPGGFFYDSMAATLADPAGQRTLFFRLPEGAAIADCTVELPLNRGIYVSDSYVTVRNIGSLYSQDDGFAGFWGQNVVLQNIYAAYNCDQGISFHGNSSTFIDGALVERNAGCGIADVMSCTTIYRNVTVRDNYPIGAILQGFAHAVYNGRFEGNTQGQVGVSHGASGSFINCLVVGHGAEVGGDSALSIEHGRLDHCTIIDSPFGITAHLGVSIDNSVVAGCATPLRILDKALPNVRVKQTLLGLGSLALGKPTFAADAWDAAVEVCPGLAGAILVSPDLLAPDYVLPDDSPHAKAAAYNTRPGVPGPVGCPESLFQFVRQQP